MDKERANHATIFESAEFDQSPEFFEKLAAIPRGEPLTWGATPLNPYYDGVLLQQAEVSRVLTRHAQDAPKDIPPHIAEYAANIFISRFRGREGANYDNYQFALKKEVFDEAASPQLTEIHDRALRGHANPAELILLRDQAEMGSVELGCVSHSYGGEHIHDYLRVMRDAIDDTIDLYGGEHLQATRYRVKSFNFTDDHRLGDALTMTRKRDLGVLPDGTKIRERSSFIVRLDAASGFNQDLAAAMRQVSLLDDTVWPEGLMRAGQLDKVVPPLLAANNFTTIIPLATTVYAYNKETVAQVERQKELDSTHMHQDEWHKEPIDFSAFPELERLMNESRQKLGAAGISANALFYHGSPIEESRD